MLKAWLRRKLEAAVETETHTAEGKRKGDDSKLAWPVGIKRPPTLQEQIRVLLQSQQLQALQRERGEETLEDSMDYGEDDDDELPPTVHQVLDRREELLREAIEVEKRTQRREARLEKERQKAAKQGQKAQGEPGEVEKVERKGEEKAQGKAS